MPGRTVWSWSGTADLRRCQGTRSPRRRRALSDVHGTCNLGRRMSTGIRAQSQSTGAQLWQTLSLVRAHRPNALTACHSKGIVHMIKSLFDWDVYLESHLAAIHHEFFPKVFHLPLDGAPWPNAAASSSSVWSRSSRDRW